MSNFSLISLQKAVYAALTADSDLMFIISGVYDHTPHNSGFPYVTFGEAFSREWSDLQTQGMDQLLSLNTWSREGGRKEAILIMEHIYQLLHKVALPVEGQTLVSLYFVTSRISLGNDGLTYQGSMQFRALLKAV